MPTLHMSLACCVWGGVETGRERHSTPCFLENGWGVGEASGKGLRARARENGGGREGGREKGDQDLETGENGGLRGWGWSG